ncbi:MAG: hypothetical protein GWO24_17745, partial [Akkermansiaceae bacterium]|nr:hypothetical protein [Akkermansiaceae bacterium]
DISAKVFDEIYKEKSAEFRPFVTVHHDSPPNFLDAPPSLDGMLRPLTQLPNQALNFTRLGLDLFQTFGGIASQGVTGSSSFPDLLDPGSYTKALREDPGNWKDWLDAGKWRPGLRDMLWSLFPRLSLNAINLKQFRDTADPWLACYQALISSQMEVQSINRAGPLGQQNLMVGQVDGGYRIDIHRYPNQPIVDALGLQVAESRSDGNVVVESFQPVVPFWLRMDTTYGLGQVIASRTRSNPWRSGPVLREALGTEEGEGKPGGKKPSS